MKLLRQPDQIEYALRETSAKKLRITIKYSGGMLTLKGKQNTE